MSMFKTQPVAAVAVAAVGLALPVGLKAQGPPITTDTAFVNGLEGAALRSFVFTVRRSGLRDGERNPDPLNRKVSVWGVSIVFPYELVKNRLVVAGGFPVLRKEMHLTTGQGTQTLSTAGIGDAFVATKLLLLQRDRKAATTRIAAKAGLKLPTGSDDERDREGNLLPPPLQLGSGSVDYAVGAVFTYVRRRVGVNADVNYDFRTEANGFAFGDSFTYNASLGYRLAPAVYKAYPARNHLNAYLELNGTAARRDNSRGLRVPDSGGNVIFLSPGMQFIPGNFLVEASLRIPVAQQLNGAQLKYRSSFVLGLRWLVL